MMRLDTVQPLPQEPNRLLKVLRFPIFHMRIHALPPNADRKRLILLPLVLKLLNDPARAASFVALGVLLEGRTEGRPSLLKGGGIHAGGVVESQAFGDRGES